MMPGKKSFVIICSVLLAGACLTASEAAETDQLLERLGSRYLADRSAAADALAKLPAEAQRRLVPKLVKLIEAEGKAAWFAQNSAAVVLQKFGPAARAALPGLRKCLANALKEKDWGLAVLLFDTMIEIDPEATKPIVPMLAKALEGDDAKMMRLAIVMLAKAGPAAKGAVPALAAALKSDDATVVQSAIETLGSIGPGASAAVPQLAEMLKHSDRAIRVKALHALKGIGAAAVPALCAELRDKDRAMDSAVVDVLGEMEEVAERAVPDLVAASKTADAKLTAKIAAALKKIKTKNSPPAVRDVKVQCTEGHAVVIELPVRDADDVAAAIRADVVEAPEQGSLERKSRTAFVYRAKPGYIGGDAFTWKATDGAAESKTMKAAVTVAADRAGPRIERALMNLRRDEVVVVFDELLEAASAGNAANYSIDGNAKITAAKVSPDGASVALKTSALAKGTSYTVTFRNVRDRSRARNSGGGSAKVLSLLPGLGYTCYPGTFNDFPDFSQLKPQHPGVAKTVKLINPWRRPGFALRFVGVIKIPADGNYTFFTVSDDGSRLFIGDKMVVDNGGVHAPRERSGKIKLTAGPHPFKVFFYDAYGGAALRALWQGPGIRKQDIPPNVLFHRAR